MIGEKSCTGFFGNYVGYIPLPTWPTCFSALEWLALLFFVCLINATCIEACPVMYYKVILAVSCYPFRLLTYPVIFWTYSVTPME